MDIKEMTKLVELRFIMLKGMSDPNALTLVEFNKFMELITPAMLVHLIDLALAAEGA